MNILHVSGVGNWGGGENHIQNLCLELAKSHPEVNNLILCVEGGQFHRKLQKMPLRFVTARRKSRIDHQFVRKIIQLCKQESIDLLHLHDPTALQLAVIADHLVNLPPFVLSKKISFPIRKNFFTLYKYNYKKIHSYICVSNAINQLMQAAIEDKDKILTIYDGLIVSDEASDQVPSLREKLKLSSEVKIIGNIANHYPAKDLATLVKVIDVVVNKYERKNIHFVQIGKFSDITQNIECLVDLCELRPYVSFLGFVDNASSYISQFDVALMTSIFEGIPLFIYECFANRVPVVTTNAGGIPEVVINHKTGFVVEKKDHIGLSEMLCYVIDNCEVASTIVKKAEEEFRNHYLASLMAKRTFDVYRSVIAASRDKSTENTKVK